MAITRINGGQILRDVRIAMDLNPKTSPLTDVGDSGTLALNDIITSKIIDAIVAVESVAPVRLVDAGTNFSGDISWDSDITGAGRITLPDNFMRLIRFKMNDWSRAVTETISEDDDLYLAQRADVKGIRGNYQKPVCAIVQDANGTELEFYSSLTKTAKISQAVYRAYPTIDSQGGVDVSTKCYRAVIYYIAALVFSTYNNKEEADTMFKLSKSELENVR